MDPDEVLAILRYEVARLIQALDSNDAWEVTDLADTVAEAFAALDKWIVAGGFLPRDWAGARHVWEAP